ncbi:Mobile element protein [Thermogutta terrifontis]|uniref:Mobile element protein n=1 Tax=Thermogutta terrifontis TaxID=1331910 RepID=A0A286RIJ9_9BACT|nr:IS1634 family transposase [Thermogutta terrifontis]ASV75788.1 Mobile element protein [Thermogutta terrifontis]
MYITTVPNHGSRPTVLLRESYREDGKVKNRTLANLTHWPAERVEALARALRGEFDNLVLGEPVCGPSFGALFAAKQVADQLGLSRVLGASRRGKLALFLVLARLLCQGSRLSAVRWASQQAVGEVLGLEPFTEDDLYRTLDELAARQARIERALYRDYLRRHGGRPPVLVLYDVTSAYLEGRCHELGAYGYSRDGKRGKLQIVVGLLTDPAGEPLAIRVFAGNQADPTTVGEQVRILKEQFGVEETVLVGDRGMVKLAGKEALTAAGLRYITALTTPQVRRLLGQGTLEWSLFDEAVAEVQAEGRRYVLRRNPLVAERERRRVADKLAKLEARVEARNRFVENSERARPEVGLRRIREWIQRYGIEDWVQVRLVGRRLVLEVDAAAREEALALAGCYVLETDVRGELLDAAAVDRCYRGLAVVERAFRRMKTTGLEIRPVYLRRADRTQAHALVCMLALKLQMVLEERLRAVFGTTAEDEHTVTLEDALTALGRLCLEYYQVNGRIELTRLPQPDTQQQKILEALGVRLPTFQPSRLKKPTQKSPRSRRRSQPRSTR